MDAPGLRPLLSEMYPAPKVAEILEQLEMEPKYGEKLAKLSSNRSAMNAFVNRLLSTGRTSGTGPVEPPSPELDEQVNSMRRQYQEFIGTEIVERKDSWVWVPDLHPDVSSGCQALGASAFFTGQQFAQAAAVKEAAPAIDQAMKLMLRAGGIPNTDKAMQVLSNSQPPSATLPALSGAQSTWLMRGGTVLTVGVLGYEFYGHIRQYWHHQIDSYELSSRLLKSLVSAVAAAAGAYGGAALLSGAGPLGVAFGGLAGALLASEAVKHTLLRTITQLFGDSRQRALGDAFKTLGLHAKAQHQEIRQQYLRLARECHPDKPSGSHDRFVRVNRAYELIRASILS